MFWNCMDVFEAFNASSDMIIVLCIEVIFKSLKKRIKSKT